MRSDIFRQEAIEYAAGARLEGDALLKLPPWTQWTYRLLIGAVAAAAALAILAFVPQYAEGPALVRAQERTSITAASPGVVASIEAAPGRRVASNDVLVRLRSVDEEAELGSLQREFDSALVQMLANPLDQAVRQTISGLRARKELLGARLEERLVRAPQSGTVGDIRVRPGQSVAPGDILVSIVQDATRFSVVALLPGQHRPSLREGQSMQIELTGYEYAYQTLTVEHVGDDVVGPSEVRRVLGMEVAEVIPAQGPVVVVTGRLSGTSFVSGGVTYDYFDGMHAMARTRVRSERLITNLIPGLKSLTESTP